MSKILLENVRLAFPSLFHKKSFEDQGDPKYQATFLISKKDHDTIDIVRTEIQQLMQINNAKVKPDNIYFKDGDDDNYSDYDGYKNHFFVKTSTKFPVILVDQDKKDIKEEDNKLIAGCYVDAVISFWYCKNYGKKICSNLHGVRFRSEGEPFGNVDSRNNIVDIFFKKSKNNINIDEPDNGGLDFP